MSATASVKKTLVPPLWIVSVVAICFVGWVLYQLKEMVILLVLSFSIAYVISPLLDWLEKRGVSRSMGVLVVGLAALSIFTASLVTTIPTLVREYHTLINNFPDYIESGKTKIKPILEFVLPYLPTEWATAIESGSISSLLALDENIPKRIAESLWSTLLSGYNLTLTIINSLLLPFLVYYISVDYQRLYDGLLSWFPIIRRERIDRFFIEIDAQVSAYVRGQLLVGFILFLMFATGLGILQVELWLLIAFISGFGNLVPYVGSIVGVTLATLMAVVTYGDLTHVFFVWGLYAIVQFVEGTFITPKIIGDSVGLSPLVVILSLLAGGSLFGLLGVFLAVPVMAALKVITRYLHTWVIHQVGH